MLLMIDNYDSFTYNLVQYLGELGADVRTVRNDRITIAEIEALAPAHIVLSPGPCAPDQAGVTLAVIEAFAGRIPLLGVCLGHEAIGQAFGGRVVKARRVMHGKADQVGHTGEGVFTGLPDRFQVVRYHSLAVEESSLPECLAITARTSDGEIMGLQHRELAVHGVQFHPESLETEHGHAMLGNFLKLRVESATTR
jgi:anthranilate synthase component 2